MEHPMQQLVMDDNVVRFRKNELVLALLRASGFTLNDLSYYPYSGEDRRQFAQLIGYSVSGYGDLPYVSRDQARQADLLAEAFLLKGRQTIVSGTSCHSVPGFGGNGDLNMFPGSGDKGGDGKRK